MKQQKVRLGCACGTWGDPLDGGIAIAEKGNVQYLGFDFLAEPTVIAQQEEKRKDPSKGFVPTISAVVREYFPICSQKGIKIVTNAGSANPEAAMDKVVQTARGMGLKGMRIAAILGGEDATDMVRRLINEGFDFPSMDTGRKITEIADKVEGAYIYTGSDAIVEALQGGADMIIAGRCSDDSLFLGPARYALNWRDDDWDLLACGITAAHIVECARGCTGGMSNLWRELPDPGKVGFPIIEMSENGEFIITKVPGTGGLVNKVTITEHLIYEVHDPGNYIMPEVITDLTNVTVEEVGKDAVLVRGAKGKGRPAKLKLMISYPRGYRAEFFAGISGPEALAKARWTEDVYRQRLGAMNLDCEEMHFDYMGYNSLHGPVSPDVEPNEIWLRGAAICKTYDAAIAVVREGAAAATTGPIGTAAMFFPPRPQQIVGLWPTLIPRELVETKVILRDI